MLTKKFIAAALAVGTFIFAPNVEAENLNYYTGTGEYIMSDSETQEFAKEGAKMQATRAAQEKAGVFVSSNTKIKNYMVEADEIETFTASIVKFIGEPKFEPLLIPGNDGKTYIKFIATITVAIDLDDLNAQIENWQNRDGHERSNLVEQNKYLQQIIDKQTKQIARLEEIIANSNSTNIQSELQKIDKDALFIHKFDAAYEEYKKGNYSNSIDLLIEASQLNPNSEQAYYNRGLAYAKLKQYDSAISSFNKAIEINPNDADAYYDRGCAYGILQQYDAAISDYTRAIEIDQNYAKAYYNRGCAYGILQQYDAAISSFNKAIEINPNDADAYYDRGCAYGILQQYDAAISDYTRAIEIDQNYAKAYNNRGNAYSDLEKYDAAISDYNKAIELNPNLVNAYNNRAVAYALSGNFKQAIIDITKYIELNPNDAKTYKLRGLCYQYLGEYEKAAADFARAKQLGYNG